MLCFLPHISAPGETLSIAHASSSKQVSDANAARTSAYNISDMAVTSAIKPSAIKPSAISAMSGGDGRAGVARGSGAPLLSPSSDGRADEVAVDDERRGLMSDVDDGRRTRPRPGADSSKRPQRGDDEEDEDEDAEEDSEGDEESTPAGVPFPSQRDPRKPLRPKNYRKKKAQRGVRKWWSRNEGLLLIALAQAFYAHMAFFFKLLNGLPGSSSVSAVQVIFIRMFFTWVCCVIYLLVTGDKHPFLGPPAVRGLLALRGFVGFFGLFGLYFSLQVSAMRAGIYWKSKSSLSTLAVPLPRRCDGDHLPLADRHGDPRLPLPGRAVHMRRDDGRHL